MSRPEKDWCKWSLATNPSNPQSSTLPYKYMSSSNNGHALISNANILHFLSLLVARYILYCCNDNTYNSYSVLSIPDVWQSPSWGRARYDMTSPQYSEGGQHMTPVGRHRELVQTSLWLSIRKKIGSNSRSSKIGSQKMVNFGPKSQVI